MAIDQSKTEQVIHWGLIGHPVAHSFSKQFFEEKFYRLGWCDATYELFDLEYATHVWDLLQQQPQLSGLNVTIPHKQAMAQLCDELSDEAKAIGAVNCIRVERSQGKVKLAGFNTDAFGFEVAFSNWWKGDRKSALILGTGGSSKAINYVLRKLEFDVQLVSRTNAVEAVTYVELAKRPLSGYGLIVNCTPLGMRPDLESCPAIDYPQLTSAHHLFDLVYNPERTLFLKHGLAAGARVQNGLRMLHLQAEKSWEIWTTS